MNVQTPPDKLTADDYASDQEVRWCPGCGDYAIVQAMRKTLAAIQAPKEKTVFISGIGCAARFPYYMSTYGFHTIHGRAPAVATGVKLANPELDIWVISGDGDALSIGGNHLLHVLRRNVDLQFILFNNEIYGLTKGQYSPTSKLGTRSPSTPLGSVDSPVSATKYALGCGARFVARSFDTHKNLPAVLQRAHEHRGASFVEIYQNCIVYNDGVFDAFTQKAAAKSQQLNLEHGKPMIYGDDNEKGIVLNPMTLRLEAATIGENGVTEANVLVHDETNRALASMLVELDSPDYPHPMGVIYCDPAPTYEAAVNEQIKDAIEKGPAPDINGLLRAAPTWTVER